MSPAYSLKNSVRVAGEIPAAIIWLHHAAMLDPLLAFRCGQAVADEKPEGLKMSALDELFALLAQHLRHICGIVQEIKPLTKGKRDRRGVSISLP